MTFIAVRDTIHILRRGAIALLVVALAVPAWAQPGAGGGQASQPLVLEPVQSGIVAAPDVKVTEFDGDAGTLVGGYVGWWQDRALLLGAAGYWLANGRRDQELAYGGLIVGWTVNGDRRIAFGARGLLGAGHATLSDTVTFARSRLSQRPQTFPDSSSIRVRYDRQFLIVEPQANVLVKLASGVRLDCGVGYRLTGAADGLDDRLRGLTGSLALRFGGQ